MLETIDADGDLMRTFEPAVVDEERDGWTGPALPTGSGLQRLGADQLGRDVPRHDPVGRAHDGACGAARDVHRAPNGRRGDGDRPSGGEAAPLGHGRGGCTGPGFLDKWQA